MMKTKKWRANIVNFVARVLSVPYIVQTQPRIYIVDERKNEVIKCVRAQSKEYDSVLELIGYDTFKKRVAGRIAEQLVDDDLIDFTISHEDGTATMHGMVCITKRRDRLNNEPWINNNKTENTN